MRKLNWNLLNTRSLRTKEVPSRLFIFFGGKMPFFSGVSEFSLPTVMACLVLFLLKGRYSRRIDRIASKSNHVPADVERREL